MALISVLLPVYNSATTLRAALLSLRKQSFADFECIALDDGSEDDGFTILQAFAREDTRFRPERLAHRGLVNTLNAGLLRCRGKYVARMDADDAMHPARLALQYALLEGSPGLSGAGCHVRLFPDRELKPKRRAYAAWLNSMCTSQHVFESRYIECPLAHPSLLLRRETALAYAYRDQGWPEDYDLLLRLLSDGHELGVVPQQLLYWRDSPGRLSRSHPAYEQWHFVRCKAAFLSHSWLEPRADYVLWGFGGTGRHLRRALLEHGKQPSTIVELHPGRIGQRIHGASVIAPDQLRELGTDVRIVVSVAGPLARSLIRSKLTELGFEPERHYVFAA